VGWLGIGVVLWDWDWNWFITEDNEGI